MSDWDRQYNSEIGEAAGEWEERVVEIKALFAKKDAEIASLKELLGISEKITFDNFQTYDDDKKELEKELSSLKEQVKEFNTECQAELDRLDVELHDTVSNHSLITMERNDLKEELKEAKNERDYKKHFMDEFKRRWDIDKKELSSLKENIKGLLLESCGWHGSWEDSYFKFKDELRNIIKLLSPDPQDKKEENEIMDMCMKSHDGKVEVIDIDYLSNLFKKEKEQPTEKKDWNRPLFDNDMILTGWKKEIARLKECSKIDGRNLESYSELVRKLQDELSSLKERVKIFHKHLLGYCELEKGPNIVHINKPFSDTEKQFSANFHDILSPDPQDKKEDETEKEPMTTIMSPTEIPLNPEWSELKKEKEQSTEKKDWKRDLFPNRRKDIARQLNDAEREFQKRCTEIEELLFNYFVVIEGDEQARGVEQDLRKMFNLKDDAPTKEK